MSALSPNPMQGRGMLKNPPRMRDNNGALQVRLRLEGRDYSLIALVVLMIQLPKPGGKPFAQRSGMLR